MPELPVIQGRGANSNPRNRFELLDVEADFEQVEGEAGFLEKLSSPHPTQYFADSSRTVIAKNDSPDVGFTYSINPYRGCSHGCIYCYARPTHEWLGMSAGLDFETKIMVKQSAPQLLRKALSSPTYKPAVLAISGVTDCYQPAEKKFRITRGCLEVLAECRNPVGVITKNHLVTRDIDLLSQLAVHQAVVVMLSITTLNAELARRMEPRTSAPRRRLEAVAKLAAAGIPVGVMVAPIIPGLTDEEIPGIMQAAADAGAKFAGYTIVRLPYAVKDLFQDWLGQHYPDRKDKILNRIREMRDGKLNDSRFFTRTRGEGLWAGQIKSIFEMAKRRFGLDAPHPQLSTAGFVPPPAPQMSLW